MIAETRLSPAHLIQPLFVHEGPGVLAIPSMPGQRRLDIDAAVAEARRLQALGVAAVALFPHVRGALRDEEGSEAFNEKGLVPRAIAAIRAAVPGIGIVCDVALDPYTSHGHDGVIDAHGRVLNDPTVEHLVRQAMVLTGAGADILAPSDMMDGRVGALRRALEAGRHHDTLILSYATKYASSQYGPFREAVGSAGVLTGDKKTYQMDPANAREAMQEIALDLEQGADMVMVKPGLSYLDIVARAAEAFPVPVLAYQVSGEYAQIVAAARNGWIDGPAVAMETLLSFRRAGARAIVTYFAQFAAASLNAAPAKGLQAAIFGEPRSGQGRRTGAG